MHGFSGIADDLRPRSWNGPVWSMLLAVGISGAVGVVFGIYPAMLAACMQPVAALRH